MLKFHLEYDDKKKEIYAFCVCNNCGEAAGQRFKVPAIAAPLFYTLVGSQQIRMELGGAFYCVDCADKIESVIETFNKTVNNAARLN